MTDQQKAELAALPRKSGNLAYSAYPGKSLLLAGVNRVRVRSLTRAEPPSSTASWATLLSIIAPFSNDLPPAALVSTIRAY